MRHVLSFLGILLGLTLLTACSSPPQTPPPVQPTASPAAQETEIPVPAFDLKDAEGKPISFTPGTDDFTLLEVWARGLDLGNSSEQPRWQSRAKLVSQRMLDRQRSNLGGRRILIANRDLQSPHRLEVINRLPEKLVVG